MSPRRSALARVLALVLASASSTCHEPTRVITLRPDDASLQPLAWLAGSWVGVADDARVEEHWLQPSGGTLAGVRRTVATEGTRALVFIVLAVVDGAVHLDARVHEGKSVTLRLTALGDQTATFASDDGEVQIRYTRIGPRLVVDSTAPQAEPRRWELHRARIGVPEGASP